MEESEWIALRRQDRRAAKGGSYNLLRLPDDITVTQAVRKLI